MGQDPPVLELRGVEKRYPGVHALRNIDVSFAAGRIHALIGENGAGKSTLLKILSGVIAPTDGQVLIDGAPVSLTSPREADSYGISMVHQELSIIPQLSLAENVVLGRESARVGVISRSHAVSEATRCLALLGWHGDVSARAGACSVATQQIAEIARALYRDQRVIILDEPTASLTPPEVTRLARNLRRLRTQGRTIIYVSHRLVELGQLGVDEVTVLRDGEFSGHFCNQDPYNETDLVRSMVGRSVEVRPLPPRPTGDVRLEVQDLKPRGGQPVSFTVRAGEVVCLAGMVGSGRTELARAVFGADRGATGSVRVCGRRLPLGKPAKSIAAGLALLTEDRKSQGLGMNMTIASNITLVRPPHRFGVLSRGAQRRQAGSAAADVDLRRDVRYPVRTLSGGNQQKVVLSRWNRCQSRVLIFDEPTRGVDIGAKEEIYAIIQTMLEQGAAVLVVSSELPEVLALGDRVLVIRDGQIVSERARGEITEEVIIADATGGKHDGS